MDFSLSEKVLQIAQKLRPFVDGEIVPLEPRLFAEGFGALEPELERLRGRAREMGLFSPQLPAAWGGAGLSLLELAHVGEILGRSPLGHYVFNAQAPDSGNMELLLQHGTAAQKERWLRPLAQGDLRSCFGMTEPEFAGSNPVWLGTTARREGETY
ncbi:MAG TPA: acyl-CoA dehydrogenase, partial [Acidobacteria bacterium]|nr:acyl-CoA dehydrogenase [Acidobacteriota bacterium]